MAASKTPIHLGHIISSYRAFSLHAPFPFFCLLIVRLNGGLSVICLSPPPPSCEKGKCRARTHVNACLLTVSDRAAQGLYDDLSGPAMREFLANKVRG